MSHLLEIKDLTVSFHTDEGHLTAVDHVSITVNTGESVGIVGESGCGKSVMAMSTLRLIPSPPGQLEHGQVLFNGVDLLTLPVSELRKIRGNRISMIFQEPMTALSPLHRIGKQLIEVLKLHRDIDPVKARNLSTEWLGKVGIPDAAQRMSAYPFQLSGGMRQRVMIAMALITNPALIIADEPTTALDVTIQAQIFELMKAMIRNESALLLITHDMGVIWEMCDRVIVMYASKIVESGPVRTVFGNPSHPYTQALLKSMPSMSVMTRRLSTINGQVPSPMSYPKGCHFCDRCPHVMARCRQQEPLLTTVSENHYSACFLLAQNSET